MRETTLTSVAEPTATDEERRAVREVADGLRELISALVLTDVPAGDLAEATALIDQAAVVLRRQQRDPSVLSRYDLPRSCGRAFSVAHGPGNPIAPPLEYSWAGETVVARCTLGCQYEGPRNHAHGGISVVLLDDVLARIPPLLGRGRVTRAFDVRYLRPVPLDAPLVVTAELADRVDTALTVTGRIRLDGADEDLVTASARFLLLRDDQLRRINTNWTPGTRWPD